MPLVLKNRNQIEHLRAAGKIVAAAIDEVRPHVQPGVTTAEFDAIAERFIRGRGALPTYKGYRGSSSTYPPFPGTICASVNEEICHGIPSSRQLKDGDVIGVDIGAQLNGWQGDICLPLPSARSTWYRSTCWRSPRGARARYRCSGSRQAHGRYRSSDPTLRRGERLLDRARVHRPWSRPSSP